MAELNKTNLLKTGRDSQIKSYIAYDGSSRMEYVYETHTDAIDGAPCLVTQYVYDGASTRITKMKETVGTWSSSYDI